MSFFSRNEIEAMPKLKDSKCPQCGMGFTESEILNLPVVKKHDQELVDAVLEIIRNYPYENNDYESDTYQIINKLRVRIEALKEKGV